MKNLKRPNAGSSLFKVFIAILAFLSSTPMPIYKHRLEKTPSQIAKIQIMELKGALQLFSWDTGRYPTTSEGLDALVRKPGNPESWRGPYLSKVEVPKDPWYNPYVYRCPGQHGPYDLFSYGRDGIEGGEGEDADVTSWGK
jgi:general secretion pathway protein G